MLLVHWRPPPLLLPATAVPGVAQQGRQHACTVGGCLAIVAPAACHAVKGAGCGLRSAAHTTPVMAMLGLMCCVRHCRPVAQPGVLQVDIAVTPLYWHADSAASWRGLLAGARVQGRGCAWAPAQVCMQLALQQHSRESTCCGPPLPMWISACAVPVCAYVGAAASMWVETPTLGLAAALLPRQPVGHWQHACNPRQWPLLGEAGDSSGGLLCSCGCLAAPSMCVCVIC
jgi:hypothetical protein